MYATNNFKSKKALKTAVLERQASVAESAGKEAASRVGVACFQPGPFGPDVADGEHCCEGPHYPEPHRWYATVVVRDGQIVRVK